MRILAIETVEQSGSVAILDDDKLVAAFDLDPEVRSAQSLSAGIAKLLAGKGWSPRDIKLTAVAIGPGSFTGLRVGVTTAKLFAYAVGADVIGVNSLEAIAWQCAKVRDSVWTLIDAQRNQVFAALFVLNSNGEWTWDDKTELLDDKELMLRIKDGQSVCGPAVAKVANRVPAGAVVINQAHWFPKAIAVGQLGVRKFKNGQRDDVFRIAPEYHRLSAADEKQRLAGSG